MDKVRLAIEARHPGCTVVQMTGLSSLSQDKIDALMVAVVNAGPPITSPEQWILESNSILKEGE